MREFIVLTYDDLGDLQAVSDYELGNFDPTVFWSGERFVGTIPADVQLVVANGSPADYLGNPISWAILSETFLRTIADLVGEDIQYFPALLFREKTFEPVAGYSVVNVTRRLDALAKPLVSVDRMVLSAASIPSDAHLFRLIGHETVLIVSREFFDVLRGKRLRGMAFIKTSCA